MSIEAMKLALEALEEACEIVGVAWAWRDEKGRPAITALRERLSQPEQTVSMTEYKRLQDLVTSQGIRLMEYESDQRVQEPFCYHDGRNIVGKEYADHSDVFPLYTAPPPRQWQGLTYEEIDELALDENGLPNSHIEFARAIEAKLRQKNT